MSKLIKYNDFIQINPDKRILSLDKASKVVLIDNFLSSVEKSKKGLVITYDLSHSGRKINNRIYSTKGQQKGIESLISPYPKPILRHHDQNGEPIGRFIGGEWQSLNDEATGFLNSDKAMLDVHNAFTEDDPQKIYKTLKDLNLLNNQDWPGLGRMRVKANITDEEAIKKFLDGRYLTFSAGSTTDRHVCSICDQDWVNDDMCEHRHGKVYDGETCVFITGDFIVLEGSVVNTPADDLSQIVEMELIDTSSNKPTEDNSSEHLIIFPKEIIMSDSNYDLGAENELQTTEQIDAYEEKEEEEESKKFDHEMSISEAKMAELHQKGETYITQRGDNETMIIKINYSGKMRKDEVEKDKVALFETEIEELIEELIDEKTFKVPAGAKGNAQKVLNWKKEKGSEVKGMTPVGWARARQLATKSEIGLSTVKRMSAFNRHRKNAAVDPKFKNEPWKDRGYVAWLGWGGTSGIDWAIKISSANDSKNNSTLNATRHRVDAIKSNQTIDNDEKTSDIFPLKKEDNMEPENKQTTESDGTVVDLNEKAVEVDTFIAKDEPETLIDPDDDDTQDPIVCVDWNILDLALQTVMTQLGSDITKDERECLPDASFCGPERSFPIPNCAYVDAAKTLVNKTKLDDAVKIKMLSLIDEKAETLECDSEVSTLKSDLKDLQEMYKSLEEKFKVVVEFIEANKKVSADNTEDLNINCEKNEDTVENTAQDELNLDDKDEKIFSLSDKVLTNMNQISSPSEHADEDASINKENKVSSLGSFEQKIVKEYKNILSEYGKDAANSYLNSKSTYLPRGFNPSNF